MRKYLKKYDLYYRKGAPDSAALRAHLREDLEVEEDHLDQLMEELSERVKQEAERLEKESEQKGGILKIFISHLENDEMREFLEDILLGKKEHLEKIFFPPSWMTVEESAFNWLVGLPYQTQKIVRKELGVIYNNALDGKYADSATVIDHIHTLIDSTRVGLDRRFMADKMVDPQLPVEVKGQIGLLLAVSEDKKPLSFWENDVDLEKHPYLLPAVMAALREGNPWGALDLLREAKVSVFKKEEGLAALLRGQVDEVLFFILNNLKNEQEFQEADSKLLKIIQGMEQRWTLELLEDVFNEPYFRKNFNPRLNKSRYELAQRLSRPTSAGSHFKDRPSREKFQPSIADSIANAFKKIQNPQLEEDESEKLYLQMRGWEEYIRNKVRSNDRDFANYMLEQHGLIVTDEMIMEETRPEIRYEFNDPFPLEVIRETKSLSKDEILKYADIQGN